jgi:3-phenylpropionate/trans-cinnamate dioxygenase ferredoxin reductase component
MSRDQHFLIIGGGLAAHAAAFSARGHGFQGDITLITEEPFRPYDRTPLSKAFMLGERDTDSLYFQPEDDYHDQRIEVLSGTPVSEIDLNRRSATLESGEQYPWSKLLIATGAKPVRLDQPGFDLSRVHYLRTIPDAESIRADLDGADRVVIVGAGFIGSEIAASASRFCKSVTLVDMASAPMAHALGDEVARICAEIHRDNGVDLQMSCQVAAIEGEDHVEAAILQDGRRIECDAVVVGVGVRPCVELFQETGLEIDNGILVDEFCRTSVPDVFAAGDVARWWHPERKERIRVEHFDNAGAQGTAAGKAVAGKLEERYAPIPYFWSDQYQTNIQFVGFLGENQEVVLRGDTETRAVTAFYLEDGTLAAGVTINQPRHLRSLRRLVAAQAVIDPDILRDPSTDLRKLSREYG